VVNKRIYNTLNSLYFVR